MGATAIKLACKGGEKPYLFATGIVADFYYLFLFHIVKSTYNFLFFIRSHHQRVTYALDISIFFWITHSWIFSKFQYAGLSGMNITNWFSWELEKFCTDIWKSTYSRYLCHLCTEIPSYFIWQLALKTSCHRFLYFNVGKLYECCFCNSVFLDDKFHKSTPGLFYVQSTTTTC